MALAHVAQLIRVLSHKLKGHGSDCQSGYMPRLRVGPGPVCVRGDISLSSMFLFLSPFPSFSKTGVSNSFSPGATSASLLPSKGQM